MSSDSGNLGKSLIYKPNWRLFAKQIVTGTLLIPFFGIGLIILAYYVFKLRSISYKLSDYEIQIEGKDQLEKVLIKDIAEVSIKETISFGILKRTDVVLGVGEISYTLYSLTEAEELHQVLSNIVHQNELRKQHQSEREKFTSTVSPGNLEKLNDLVGYWQQGLLTNEEFEKESQKFL